MKKTETKGNGRFPAISALKISRQDLKGLKYYLGFSTILILIYLYSMFTGWRFMSFGESSHSKERGVRTRTYIHK